MVKRLSGVSPALIGVVGVGVALLVAKLVLDDPQPIVLGLIGGVGAAAFILVFATVQPPGKPRKPTKPVGDPPEKP